MPPNNLLGRLFACETLVFLSSASIPTHKPTGIGATISTPLCAADWRRGRRGARPNARASTVTPSGSTNTC